MPATKVLKWLKEQPSNASAASFPKTGLESLSWP